MKGPISILGLASVRQPRQLTTTSRARVVSKPPETRRIRAMEVHTPIMDHPKKRRRRRRIETSPLTATLVLDPKLKGEQGVLSQDLYEQLPDVQYVAISPWAPQDSDTYQNRPWTIIPFKIRDPIESENSGTPLSVVKYPSSSTSQPHLGISGSRILVSDVQPVTLSIVYVEFDGEALKRHEQIQKEFGGGFGAFRYPKGKSRGKARAALQDEVNGVSEDSKEKQQEDELTTAIRRALGSLSIIRKGDLLPLPLPAHPITHVPLSPAKIILCEPVDQGLLSAKTQVVVDKHSRSRNNKTSGENRQYWSPPQAPVVENGEETSNEHFYPAVEDGMNGLSSPEENEDVSDSSSSKEDGDGDGESDDSADEIISLAAPGLTQQSMGMSPVTATPNGCGRALDGIRTPGSLISSFTITTARENTSVGKSFQAYGLMAPIPDDFLHPRPRLGEDDEARVYVDIKDLLKLRCFSGDWVKIFAATRVCESKSKEWTFDDLSGDDDRDDNQDFRVAKIYGLQDVATPLLSHPTSKFQSPADRRSSLASFSRIERPVPQAWLSPILIANIDGKSQVRISPMMTDQTGKRPFSPRHSAPKAGRSEGPPIAVEVSLAKISTPTSQETALQESLFLKLKQFFEVRKRIIKSGDLIALTIDASIGRILGTMSSTNADSKDAGDLLSLIQSSSQPTHQSLNVVWFQVANVVMSKPGKGQELHGPNSWAGTVSVEPSITRMTMGASCQRKIPSTLQSHWKSYLGLVPRLPVGRPSGPLALNTFPAHPAYTSILQRRLRELVAAATSPRATTLGLEPTMILLHSNQRNTGKATVVNQAASDLGIHAFAIDGYDIISEGNAGDVQESSMNTRIARGLSCGARYTAVLVRHLEALTSNRMISAIEKVAKCVRVLIATTSQLDQLPENLRSLFTHELEMTAPDEGEREGIMRNVIEKQGIRIADDVDLAAIAVKTAALVAGNLADIVERASIAREERLSNLLGSTGNVINRTRSLIRDLMISGGDWACSVIKTDFDVAVDAARKNFADAIGAPKIPNVSWEDVGGLENVKDAVMETIQLPLERPELFAKGMKKRSGILFYGPPGTGKTLLAKAIATEFSLNFFSVKGPELLNMYIGESEANVRRVFQRARDARPCVVFFDELDSVAPKRGNQGDSGGVMDRIVSQLLAELDGMSNGDEGGGGVFVIGATNRPDLLDQALLRPGRFDKMLYLGISDTHRKQTTILEALTRKFSLHPGLDLVRVAESLPFTYTGADLYALCSDAMLKAITRQASAVDAKIKALPNGPVSHAFFFDHLASKEDIAVTVTEADFEAARKELVGSVR